MIEVKNMIGNQVKTENQLAEDSAVRCRLQTIEILKGLTRGDPMDLVANPADALGNAGRIDRMTINEKIFKAAKHPPGHPGIDKQVPLKTGFDGEVSLDTGHRVQCD